MNVPVKTIIGPLIANFLVNTVRRDEQKYLPYSDIDIAAAIILPLYYNRIDKKEAKHRWKMIVRIKSKLIHSTST